MHIFRLKKVTGGRGRARCPNALGLGGGDFGGAWVVGLIVWTSLRLGTSRPTLPPYPAALPCRPTLPPHRMRGSR